MTTATMTAERILPVDPTYAEVVTMIADALHVAPAAIQSTDRHEQYGAAKQLVAYVLKRHCHWNIGQIASHAHVTPMAIRYRIEAADVLLMTNPRYKRLYSELVGA